MMMSDDDGFDLFWRAFPRRVSKKEAKRAWAQIRPDAALLARILAALAWQSQDPQWLHSGGQYIPYPASWLRGERWDDEPTQIPMERPRADHSPDWVREARERLAKERPS